MWVCPQCGKEFKNTNQWHSCARLDVGVHLANKPPRILAIYDKLVAEVERFGDVRIEAVKTAIQIRTSSTFLSVKVKRNHVEVEFQLASKVDRYPVYRNFQISKNRFLHSAVLEDPDDLDAGMIDMLREAYDLSNP